LIERLERIAAEHGPAEAFGLLRIGLVLLVWSEWGRELQLFRSVEPSRLGLSVVFWIATGALFVGFRSRIAAIATMLCVQWIYQIEGHLWGKEAWAHHHSWVIVSTTSLLALAPVERWWSVDAWLARRAGAPLSPDGPQWVRYLIGFQLCNVYFWGAWDKTSAAFLSGERMQHHMMSLFWGSDPVPGGWFAPLMAALAVLTVGIEYALPFALWSPRWRTAALLAGVGLHALFYVLLPVGTFSAVMVLCYLAFLPPESIRRALRGG
jgi:hypothetical protein